MPLEIAVPILLLIKTLLLTFESNTCMTATVTYKSTCRCSVCWAWSKHPSCLVQGIWNKSNRGIAHWKLTAATLETYSITLEPYHVESAILPYTIDIPLYIIYSHKDSYCTAKTNIWLQFNVFVIYCSLLGRKNLICHRPWNMFNSKSWYIPSR